MTSDTLGEITISTMKTKQRRLVKNGTVVTGAGMYRWDVLMEGEKITAVGPGLESGPAEARPGKQAGAETGGDADLDVIDASGMYVLPGIIDAHTHPYYKDDFRTLASTAAYGGVTTLIHYAYAFPDMGALEAAEKAVESGTRESCLDFALHLGMFQVEKQYRQVPQVFKLGINSFKMFMAYAKLGRMTSDYYLAAVMDLIAEQNGIAMVHAENGLVTDYLEDKYNAQGVPAMQFFSKMRPDVLEAEAINRAIAIAEVCGCRIYIPHVSARRALEPIETARDRGQTVYAETCPQYLTLTEEDFFRWGALAKIGPPLRHQEDLDALWRALDGGVLDVVASDHAPKGQRPDEDFFKAAYGSAQAETLLLLTYDGGVNTGRISLPRLVEVLCENPARIFGLYPRKGTLQPGSDADLVIFDPAAEFTLKKENQHSEAGFTLYEGRECLGRPVMSYQRGRPVLRNGELAVQAGDGIYLSRPE